MFNLCPECGKLFFTNSSCKKHLNLVHGVPLDNKLEPRSLSWLLFPFFLGVLGSLILHRELRHDKKRHRGIIIGINRFNWIMGILVTIFSIWGVYESLNTFSVVVIGDHWFWSVEPFSDYSLNIPEDLDKIQDELFEYYDGSD